MCTCVRAPVVNLAAAGLKLVVRCEAPTGCHVLPVSAGTGINESLGTATEEDEMSLCVIGSHPLVNSLDSSVGVPVHVSVLLGVDVFAALIDSVVGLQDASCILERAFEDSKLKRNCLGQSS